MTASAEPAVLDLAAESLDCVELQANASSVLMTLINAVEESYDSVAGFVTGTPLGQPPIRSFAAGGRTARGRAALARPVAPTPHPASGQSVPPPAPRTGHAGILDLARRQSLARTERAAPERLGLRERAAPPSDAFQPTVIDTTIGATSVAKFFRGACDAFRPLRVRTTHVIGPAVLLEDRGSPLAGTMDSALGAIGREIDARILPLVRSHFGDPLAADQLLGGTGRFYLLFTDDVASMKDAGFVGPCDFSDPTDYPASNRLPLVYIALPTAEEAEAAKAAGRVDSLVAGWTNSVYAIVAHELKHLAAGAVRLRLDLPAEVSWLEEGSAMVAEDLYYRELCGIRLGEGADGATLARCADRLARAGTPRDLSDVFGSFHEYYQSIWSHSPLGPTSAEDNAFYGAAWSLLRWALDADGDESRFLQALVREPRLTGVRNLEHAAGQRWPDLLAGWSASLLLDSVPAGGGSHRRATWGLRSMMAEPPYSTGNGPSGELPAPDPRGLYFVLRGGTSTSFRVRLDGRPVLLSFQREGGGRLGRDVQVTFVAMTEGAS